jgi:hypothetical protein
MLFEILNSQNSTKFKEKMVRFPYVHGFQVGSQKLEKYVKKFLMPYLAHSQV